MKKLLFLGATATLALASCKKDYTCECVGSVNGIKVEESASSVTINDTKSAAIDECNKGDITEANGISIDCEIK
jgi:hypothetical protein